MHFKPISKNNLCDLKEKLFGWRNRDPLQTSWSPPDEVIDLVAESVKAIARGGTPAFHDDDQVVAAHIAAGNA